MAYQAVLVHEERKSNSGKGGLNPQKGRARDKDNVK
jgi:hypothetical protein